MEAEYLNLPGTNYSIFHDFLSEYSGMGAKYAIRKELKKYMAKIY